MSTTEQEHVSESTDIARIQASPSSIATISDGELNRLFRIAKGLAQSGIFKDARQEMQAFAKICIGRDLGLSPTQALMSIDIVKGNIMLRGVLLASFVRKSPDHDYKVIEHTDTRCAVMFRRRWEGEWEDMGEEVFEITDANRAKLVKQDSAWTSHPKNMLVWRCLSNGVKFYCPELLGGVPIYVEGEVLDAEVAPDAAGSSGPEGATPDIVDAVPVDVLPDEEREELLAAFQEAGVEDTTMFLSAAGLSEDDQITPADALKLRELLGDYLAGAVAA